MGADKHNFCTKMMFIYSLFIFMIPTIMGHGNMMRPRTWWNPVGWKENQVGCGVLDLPPTEFEEKKGIKPDCMNLWYSNHVEIPGHATLPDHVSQPEVTCIGQAGHNDKDHKFPWWSPGTTPISVVSTQRFFFFFFFFFFYHMNANLYIFLNT